MTCTLVTRHCTALSLPRHERCTALDGKIAWLGVLIHPARDQGPASARQAASRTCPLRQWQQGSRLQGSAQKVVQVGSTPSMRCWWPEQLHRTMQKGRNDRSDPS